MTQAVRSHLLRAQQRMKHQADKRRCDRQFSVRDMVYLKLQPYVQSSVSVRANHKLSYKFFGPYCIVQRIGSVAYKLELPPTASIHPVFHVSQLKPSVKTATPVSSSLPYLHADLQVPSQVLGRRSISRGCMAVDQVKVRWSGYDDALDTWEDEVALRQRFPSSAVWGQPTSHGGENVSPQASKEAPRDSVASDELSRASSQEQGTMGRRVRTPNGRVMGGVWVN
jgi:hypothetical protein